MTSGRPNTRRSGSGALNRLITFQEYTEGDDGHGGVVVGYVDRFTEPARMQPRTGTESVQASRLAGVQPYSMTIRSSERTRAVTPAWRAYDARAGLRPDGQPVRSFNIKTVVNIDERNAWLELIVVEGQSG